MTCRCKSMRRAAEQAAEEALEQGSSVLEDVINVVLPRAKQATHQAAEYVAPLLEDARDRVVPVLQDARGRVVPAFEDARGRVVPAFQDARGRLVPLVHDVADRVSPAVHDAYEAVSDKVTHDVYPRLQELWEEATEDPRVAEASLRGRSALAALKGDLALPEPAPVVVSQARGVLSKIVTVLGVAALIAAIVVAVRTVLGSSDDGWSPAEPMSPGDDGEDAGWGANPFAEDVTAADDVDTSAAVQDAEAEAEMVAEGGPADESAQRAEPGYGEGAYVGSEPPEGYVIKGNERSMKYHTQEAAGYDRTNADVWFNSEEAAQAAGFTRALR